MQDSRAEVQVVEYGTRKKRGHELEIGLGRRQAAPSSGERLQVRVAEVKAELTILLEAARQSAPSGVV